MNKFEDYIKSLAADLRGNGLDDAKVGDILAEIVADPKLDRSNPELTLGHTKELAASYGKGNRRSLGFKVISGAALIAFLIIGTKVVSSLVFGVQTTLIITLATYGIGIAIFIVGLAIGAVVDRRLPDSIKEQLPDDNAEHRRSGDSLKK